MSRRSGSGTDAGGAPAMEVDVRLARGEFTLEAAFGVLPGITALFGPSGAGKSTILRILAGLEPSARGRVTVGGETWLDTEEGAALAPHHRRVGFVFQDAQLLPHLTVAGNLAYGARRGGGRGPSRDEVVGWLKLDGLLSRLPDGLSGGERQRVALGRALLRGPRVLLLDEPLASLDRPMRRELLEVLEALPLRHPMPILLVTHDLEEAIRLAPEMVWLADGRVQAAAPTHEVLARTDFVRWRGDDAGVAAPGRVTEHVDDGLTHLDTPWGRLAVPGRIGRVGRTVRLRILARDVSLAWGREEHSTLVNQFPVVVRAVETLGEGECLVRMAAREGGDELLARVTRRSASRLELAQGREVWARVKSVAVAGT